MGVYTDRTRITKSTRWDMIGQGTMLIDQRGVYDGAIQSGARQERRGETETANGKWGDRQVDRKTSRLMDK